MGSSSSSLGHALIAGAAWGLSFIGLLCGGSLRHTYDSVSVQRLPDSTQFLHDGASSSLLPPEKLLADEVLVQTLHVRPLQCSHEGYDVKLPMLVPDINDDGVVVARRIAAVVNLSEDDHYEVLIVVLNALHLLLDVSCVELWDIVYFVPKEDVALLLCYSKCILCYMLLELPQVTIVVDVLFKEGHVWIGILEWLDVMLCQ